MKLGTICVTLFLLSSTLWTHSASAQRSTTAAPPDVETVAPPKELAATTEEIVPPTEDTAKTAEETAAPTEDTPITAEEVVSSTEDSDTTTKETVSSTEDSDTTTKETVSSTEDSDTTTKETVSSTEDSDTAAKETVPPTEDTAATTEETAAATDAATGESTAPADDTVATTEKTAAPTEDAPAASEETTPSSDETMDMSEVIALLRQQQKELADQRKLLDSQSLKIATLTRELDGLREKPPVDSDEFVAKPETARETDSVPVTAPTVVVAADSEPDAPKTDVEKAIATGDEIAQAQADDPSRAMLDDFKGAWRLPGTNAALAIGGFVKTSIVYNFDPLQIEDRFIVGSIPVGIDETTGDEAQSSVTADQSRLNFDLRSPTDYGVMRAFIEGDFAESNETFRLRHAFGQWNRMLAGKTWTTFMDPGASPEEIDFEGLNGRINVRQAQMRFMPTFGEKYELQFALEDPNPEVQNGSGVTRTPDLVLAGRFDPYDRLHLKLALMAREIRGQSNSGNVAKEFAWGTSLSGNISTPNWDARDKFLFQLSYGNGIGRYVNDLSSIGNYDGIFNPDNGDLELFDIVAGYVSWQHWWGINELRSNFTAGVVDVDNPGFVGGDEYQNTLRFSSNLIWSPIPRIDVGGEYLWGRRENEDGESGDATQLQLAVKYRF